MNKEESIRQDNTLLAALCRNDRDAFNILFKKYYTSLCAYAYRFVDLGDAEEIVQDILLWLWENRKTITVKVALSAYLFRSVHNRCLSSIEQKEVKQRAEALYWQKSQEDIPADADGFVVSELLLKIHESIGNLPPSYKEAFVLHRFKDRSYREIAACLNVSHKTVDYRIQQALKLLREDLKDYFPLIFLCLFSFFF